MDFFDRIRVWEDTSRTLESGRFLQSSGTEPKFPDAAHLGESDSSTDATRTRPLVHNEDAIALARSLVLSDACVRPLVLIMADHRFCGGEVKSGSGAQEESLFRRTTLGACLRQEVHYPIRDDEANFRGHQDPRNLVGASKSSERM